MPQNNEEKKRSNRGFAAMDAAKQREIASKGGQAAHQQGTAHRFTSEEARLAGQKGGLRRGKGAKASTQNRIQEQPQEESRREESSEVVSNFAPVSVEMSA